jgi:hypothetical protein
VETPYSTTAYPCCARGRQRQGVLQTKPMWPKAVAQVVTMACCCTYNPSSYADLGHSPSQYLAHPSMHAAMQGTFLGLGLGWVFHSLTQWPLYGCCMEQPNLPGTLAPDGHLQSLMGPWRPLPPGVAVYFGI